MDLTGKTIRLYETCPKCKGTGLNAFAGTCQICRGKGHATTHVKFEDMAEALQAIAKGAAEYVAQQKAKPATVVCKSCYGTGTAPHSNDHKAWDCPACLGTGQVTP